MRHMDNQNTTADILVVDDTPDNLRLLLGILEGQGYNARPASDGTYAISTAQANPPDLILLDIKMPDMNGYDVCEQLKTDERTRHVPVIFISALDGTFDKVKGLSAGAVDYISKPFQTEEVLARVETHLTIWRLQQKLQDNNAQLQQEIKRREQAEEGLRQLNRQLQKTNRQLQEANQELLEANDSKDTLFSIIAHDLRNPFSVLLTLTEFLVEEAHFFSKEQITEKLDQLYLSAKKVYSLVANLLEWSRLERGIMQCTPEQLRLADIVEKNVRLFHTNSEQKQILLKNLVPYDVRAYADYKMIDTVIRNLISNALKFTESDGIVEIGQVCQNEQTIEFAVTDSGIGMDKESLEALFRIEKKSSKTGTDGEEGSGLGLVLCKELVERNSGGIHVESELGTGSRFIVSLPCGKNP